MSVQVKNRIFISPKDNITRYENNLVNLTTGDGQVYESLEPRRLFPVSSVDTYITLMTLEGKEIAIIRKLDDLNEESLKVIKESLNDYYLVPYITEIMSITEKSGTLKWKVKTNRGLKNFEVRNRNHDIRVYKDGTVRIRDSSDNRYIIEDYRKLDSHSRRQLSPDL